MSPLNGRYDTQREPTAMGATAPDVSIPGQQQPAASAAGHLTVAQLAVPGPVLQQVALLAGRARRDDQPARTSAEQQLHQAAAVRDGQTLPAANFG